jgi:TnpA family transposase
LGFGFAPRIRDLTDKRLYANLAPLIGGKLNLKLVRMQWEEILRLAASIRHGTVTASLIIRKPWVQAFLLCPSVIRIARKLSAR